MRNVSGLIKMLNIIIFIELMVIGLSIAEMQYTGKQLRIISESVILMHNKVKIWNNSK